MVQTFQTGNPQGKIAEMLGMSLGQGLGQGVNTFFANRSLESVMHDKSLKGASSSEKLSKLQQALAPYGEQGQQLFQQRMQIEQQGLQESKLKKQEQAGKSVYESLVKAGYPEETAKIWQMQMENSPIGGQSDIIRNVNDLITRSKAGKGLSSEVEKEKQVSKPTIDIPGINSEDLELDFPELPEPIGLKPNDVVKQNEYREKTNIPIYTETVDRLNALDDEYREVTHLQDLNEIPGALPTGIDKWNVDWDTGDLRVKALATPEAQDYVKTIARMARRAKDFFPGRVTNFDLDQFKAGFPTLANSPEGRRLIAKQLALSNRIAYLKDETYKAAVDHYGSGADPVLIKKYATENYRRLKGKLEKDLKSINDQADNFIKSQPEEKTKRPSLEEIFG